MNERNNPNQVDKKLLTVSDRDIFVTVQKALLVGIILRNETRADKEESLKELTNLVKTAGSTPYIVQTKRIDKIDPKTFIGKGSIKELEDISKSNDIDVVVFDCELTPNQQKELRVIFQCDVVDRTGLILDIFALHAQSKEASLQVELAMSVYLKPRLAGLAQLVLLELSRLRPAPMLPLLDFRILRESSSALLFALSVQLRFLRGF